MSLLYKDILLKNIYTKDFDFSDLSDLSIKLYSKDADTVIKTPSTELITDWISDAPGSNDVSALTDGARPLYDGTLNGRRVITFSGSQELVKKDITPDPNTNDCTWFVLGKFDVGAIGEGLFSSEDSMYRQQLSGIRMTGINWIEYNWNTNWHIATSIFRIGGGNDSELLIDGVSQGIDDLNNSGINGFRIGSLEGGSFLNGKIAVVIRYEKVVPAHEQALVLNKIRRDYGMI